MNYTTSSCFLNIPLIKYYKKIEMCLEILGHLPRGRLSPTKELAAFNYTNANIYQV